jgi:hypothetical protein
MMITRRGPASVTVTVTQPPATKFKLVLVVYYRSHGTVP